MAVGSCGRSVNETNQCRFRLLERIALYRETKSAEAPPTPKMVIVLILVQFSIYSNTCSNSVHGKYLALETVYSF